MLEMGGHSGQLHRVISAQTFRWWGLALMLGTGLLRAAGEGPADRVVILANSRQPESVKLAEFYAAKRAVPMANIVALPMPETESVTWRQFIDEVYQPVQDELYRRGWIEGTDSSLLDRLGRKRYALIGHHISYLVVCRGVPLRIYNDPALLVETADRKISPQLNKNEAAVDSELSLLAQSGYEITAFVANPLFANEHPSSLEAGTVVKVSRLDGPTFESARRLVTSALEGERSGLIGRAYVDLNGPDANGDKWLESVHAQLRDLGFDTDVERTSATFGAEARFDAPVLYFGWYHADLNGPFSAEGFAFPPGAVAMHIHSFSAQTLQSDAQGWCGPLVARGVAATVGNVFEPYLELTHRPDLLLHALIQGRTLGDAVYFAQPALSWQTMAIGDPLYRPFKVSLEEQEKQSARLAPALAPYVIIRRANLLVKEGRTDEALAVLKAALERRPSLALGLSLARRALAENAAGTAVSALEFATRLKTFNRTDWPLGREIAGLLSANGARPAALQVYANLVQARPPTSDALKTLLAEALATADAAGDRQRSLDFSRQLSELTKSSPVAP